MKRKKAKLGELPSSKNKNFWGEDAEILNFNVEKDAVVYQPNPGHEWRQQGPFLICNSCPLKHAVRIGIDKRLMGFDKNGQPIIEKVDIRG